MAPKLPRLTGMITNESLPKTTGAVSFRRLLGSGVTNPSVSDELLWLLLYPGLCELVSAAAQLSGASWLLELLS